MIGEGEFVAAVEGMCGVVQVTRLSSAVVREAVSIEESIRVVSGGLRMDNAGVHACASREMVFAVVCDSDFLRPDTITMELVDDDGVVIGHDVPRSMRDALRDRQDLVWLSEDFVMFPDRIGMRDARLVMHASRLDVGLGQDPWVFYPSISSAEMLNRRLGIDAEGLSTMLMGIDGLSPASVPVADVVKVPSGRGGHGEPSPEYALYRGDLVGEPLEVAELPLADEDLHALVMV